jgi:hypothetical protein
VLFDEDLHPIEIASLTELQCELNNAGAVGL